MGTSASSRGPGPGVPFVPPWVPPVPLPSPPEKPAQEEPVQDGEGVPSDSHSGAPDIAPKRRFAGARLHLGSFANTGSREDLERGLGHYVGSGLGGSGRGVRRLASTARTADALYGVLQALRTGQRPPIDLGVDLATLAGRPAREIMDLIVQAIRPIDGTQDADANHYAISAATSDLLVVYPAVDLTALNQDQIDFLIETYVGHDLCERIELDVGDSIQQKAPNPIVAVRRLEEIKDYVIAKVRAAFTARRSHGERLERGRVGALVAAVLRDTLDIFEDYLR